ncbi:MAG: hypothetical protein KDB27_35255 [Planctomycetales bacterium]|nr:hypothetical protein [Planctomycetales bacterium]
MKTLRPALVTLCASIIFSATVSAGEELEFTWTDIEDFYLGQFQTVLVIGEVSTPAPGEQVDGENIIMLVRPGTQYQEVGLDTIGNGGVFDIEVEDLAAGNPLPVPYVLLAYDSAGNYDGYGGTAEEF